MKKRSHLSDNSLALRTDFSDEAAWNAVCAAIQEPDSEFGFTANVNFVNDREFEGLTVEQLPHRFSRDDASYSFAFIIDHKALSESEHPILVVDLSDDPGRTFRAG